MAVTVNGSNKFSLHNSFWNALTKNSDSLALSQLWLCGFNKDKFFKSTGIIKALADNLNNYEVDTWENINNISNTVFNDANWDSAGADSTKSGGNVYLLARGISFPGDGINTSRVGVSQTGSHKGLISDGRTELSTTNITFLETNVSFVDGILRPWSVLVGYRSLKDQSLRCDIELFALEKWEQGKPLQVRKSMVLKNAAPVNIDTEEYNYTGDKLIERQVQFAFDRYEMHVYHNTTDRGVINEKIEWNEKSAIINTNTIPSNNLNQNGDLLNIGNPIIYRHKWDIPNFNTHLRWNRNTQNRDNPIIYLDKNNNIIDNPSINSDVNDNISDNPSINSDINDNILDKPIIDPDINNIILDNPIIDPDINTDQENGMTILTDEDINEKSDIVDNSIINSDINVNILNESKKIKIDENLYISDNTNIENNSAIKYDINPNQENLNRILTNTDINLNIKDNPVEIVNETLNISDNNEPKYIEKPIIINTSDISTIDINNDNPNRQKTIKYILNPDASNTTAKLNWTPGRSSNDSANIVSDIHINE